MKLLNAFSINMLAEFNSVIRVVEISLEEAKRLAQNTESAVGHPDTAAVFSSQLGIEVPANRATIALNKGETALVGQYRGPRLPEGATTLPEGASIVWCTVTVE